MLEVTSNSTSAVTNSALLTIFMVFLILPVSFDVAGMRLTPVRMFLLVLFIPNLIILLQGKAGPLVLPDLLMTLFAIWMGVTLLIHHGVEKLAFSGISLVELLGGYFLGRVLIRNPNDFRLLIKLHLIVMLIMFPFAIAELLTGKQYWAIILDNFGSVVYRANSSRPRWGLDRVLAGFEHPILFGLFCSMAAANAFYVWKDKISAALLRFGFVVFMTFMSLSSGALLSVMIQGLFILWDWVTKSKWKTLLLLAVTAYISLEFLSNRGPIVLFVETLTFSPGNAWVRIVQWQYGSAEVLRHPVFGMGMTPNWIRPSWLHTSSIDNYWLVIALRHGIVGVVFLLTALAFTIWKLVRARNLPAVYNRYRTGYLITLVGICFTLSTVHIWGAVSVYIFFYIGAGMWIAQPFEQNDIDAKSIVPDSTPSRSKYTRYSRKQKEQPSLEKSHIDVAISSGDQQEKPTNRSRFTRGNIS